MLTSCAVFAAHGAQIPERDEEAANNVPGKVSTADRGEGLQLLFILVSLYWYLTITSQQRIMSKNNFLYKLSKNEKQCTS